MIDSLKDYANEIHTQSERLFVKIKKLNLSKSVYEKNPSFLDYKTDLEQFKASYKTLLDLPRPQNSFFLELAIDKKIHTNNPLLIKKLYQFEVLYKEQENRVATEFGKIIEEIGTTNEVVPHYTHNKINLDKHFMILDRMVDLKNKTCQTHSIDDDLYSLYYMLPINYRDIIEDVGAYEYISCCVSSILQENKNSFIKIVANLDYIPIESENFPLVVSPIGNKWIVDDNITWAVRYLDSLIPFAIMKYSKKSYNIIHELAIGMVLNTIRNLTPNFMYTWGGFSCSPPLNTDYKSICSNTDPKSMEIIMLTEYVDSKYTFSSFLEDKSVSNYSKHLIDLILQIMCSLTIAQARFRFMHANMYDGNVLIKKLASPVTLAYTITELNSSEPFTVTLENVLYIAIITDYEYSGIIIEKISLEPLLRVNFSPTNDILKLIDIINTSQAIALIKLIITDYSESMYHITRNVYNIIHNTSTELSSLYNNIVFISKPDLNCRKMVDGFGEFTCMELPLSDIKYIIGPCSFHYFKYGSRNIYLFGEQHLPLERSTALIVQNQDMTQANTIMFAGFVHSLVTQNPTRTYDLMFESSYFLEKRGNKFVNFANSPTFNSISTTFRNCIEFLNRKECPYKNLRTHYVDFRKSKEVDHKDLATDTNFAPRPGIFNANVKNFLTSGKVSKQIAAIKDVRSRDALAQYVNDFLDDSLVHDHTKPIIIMDIYAIARLLREFDPTIEKNTQFKGTSENIIYYAGAVHTQQMVHFFTKYMHLAQSDINKPYKLSSKCESFINLDVSKKSLNFV